MAEWMACGRFPVGGSLRVRLPEWRQHLTLHELYPDLGAAFVLPPAWPDDDECCNLGPGVRRARLSDGSGEESTKPSTTPQPAPVCVVAPSTPAQASTDDGKQLFPPPPAQPSLEELHKLWGTPGPAAPKPLEAGARRAWRLLARLFWWLVAWQGGPSA